MATTHTCDACTSTVDTPNDLVEFRFGDGESAHTGNLCYTTQEICKECLFNLAYLDWIGKTSIAQWDDVKGLHV